MRNGERTRGPRATGHPHLEHEFVRLLCTVDQYPRVVVIIFIQSDQSSISRHHAQIKICTLAITRSDHKRAMGARDIERDAGFFAVAERAHDDIGDLSDIFVATVGFCLDPALIVRNLQSGLMLARTDVAIAARGQQA